jgi:hypothetical protein
MKWTRGRKVIVGSMAIILLVAAAALAVRHYYPPTRFDPEKLARYYRALRVSESPAVDPVQVRAAASEAAGYIRRVNEESGRFIYTLNLNREVAVEPDYSILRHEGTIYAIGMVDDVIEDPANVAVMQRAVAYLKRCCYRKIGETQIAIAEPDDVSNQWERDKYKLGGAGLGLLALTSLQQKMPGSSSPEELHAISRFGMELQSRSGAMYASYSVSEKGPADLGKSLYYPGEMALGWLALYELYPADRKPFDAAVKTLRYLASVRQRGGVIPADHWALLATARLFDIASRRHLDIPREALLNHALQVCDAMLEEARHPQPIEAMEGSLAPSGAVTPTATRLEGLQAALTFLPPDHPIVPHIYATVERGIDFLLRAQVKEGPHAGALPTSIATLPDDGEPNTRRFNERATEVRIDYVQHSLSAMVQYLKRTGSAIQ